MHTHGSFFILIAFLSVRETVGIFWNVASETWIDIAYEKGSAKHMREDSFLKKLFTLVSPLSTSEEKSSASLEPSTLTHWMSESGVIDFFVFLGPRPGDVFKQYGDVTGFTTVPPMFSLGYHQSRWNYVNEEDVLNVDANFYKYDLPMDTLWLDIEYTDDKRYFTWHKNDFPNPSAMIKNISSRGRKMVVIIDPHIKKDDNYFIYKEASSASYWIKKADGKEDYVGSCWPGDSKYPDFLRKDVREWWASKFATNNWLPECLTDVHIWNDMNEPSVFSGPEVTIHKDALHLNNRIENREIHNLYGFYLQAATYKGLALNRFNGIYRPFLLSRAFFAGSQRFGSVWTGDNLADWDHLKISTPMLLSLSITGITFCGADVGGFFNDPDEELLRRWYQTAIYQPFFRSHSHIETRRREPWLFSQKTLKNIRHSLQTRYALLPYLYTLFFEAETKSANGPPLRPLWFEFPEDKEAFDKEDSFMLGSALLVHPIVASNVFKTEVYLPFDCEELIWYDVNTNEGTKPFASGKTFPISVSEDYVPVFQKSSSIIPKKMRPRSNTVLMRHDPYTLIVTLDSRQHAHGSLFIDDGETFFYRSKQIYFYCSFEYRQESASIYSLSSKISHSNLPSLDNIGIERIVVIGAFLNGFSAVNSIHRTSDKDSSGSTLFFTTDHQNVLEIKKPIANINSNWSILLSFD